MNHIYLMVIFVACGELSTGQTTTPEERWANWHKERTAAREAATKLPPEQQIKILGGMVQLGSMGEKMNEQQRDVYENALPLLLAIPGHAEYYTREIEAAREKALVLNGPGQPPNWISYDRFRAQAFRVMGQLPSVETVRVLGNLLHDERDYQSEEYLKANPDNARTFGMNASGAAGALSNLGIAFSPDAKPGDKVVYRDLEFWRLWYEQVKAGNRTFRFAGDHQEYNLTGPVSVAKAPVTDRPDKRIAAATLAEAEKVPDGLPVPAILAAALAVLTAGWYFLRARNKRTA